MRSDIAERRCDHCGKTVQSTGTTIGGSPFHGWLQVTREFGSSRRPMDFPTGPWDFCSPECLRIFFEKKGHDRVNLQNRPLVDMLKESVVPHIEDRGWGTEAFTHNPRGA